MVLHLTISSNNTASLLEEEVSPVTLTETQTLTNKTLTTPTLTTPLANAGINLKTEQQVLGF